MNEKKLAGLEPSQSIVRLYQWEDVEAELDETGRFVNSKKEQRWLWHAINYDTNDISNPALHSVGKCNTQKIERKHLTLGTRIKRLARKTICFSKSM